MTALLVGCDDEPTGTDTADPFCDEAPLPVTWDNFGRSFLTERCQPCHASTRVDADRQGAPEEITFDTEEQAWMLAPRILGAALGDEATMPPRGGLDDNDRYLLEVWLTCGG